MVSMTRRPNVLAAALVVTSAAPSFAHDARNTENSSALARPLFTSGLPGGVTFTPGPISLDGVTFTPGPLNARDAEPIESNSRASAPPRASMEPLTAPAPASSAGAYGCALVGEVARVDLALASNALRPVQVTLATRGRDAVALVTLGRPGGAHEGMVFPESRWVTIPASGAAPRVFRAPGFEPDASVALGEDGGALVVSYTRLDVRAGPERSRPAVRSLALRADGSAVGAPLTLDQSEGLSIDSPVVAWRGGYAVVLGRESVDASGARGPVREALYVLDASGAPARAPWLLTDEQGDDTIGRYRVGLRALGNELRASWTVSAGPSAGVWVRRYDQGPGEPHRVVGRAAWGSEVAFDGSGVLYRAGGERDAPVELFYSPWEGGEAQSLGAGWDPAMAFVRGRVLVAGVSLIDGDGREFSALMAAAQPCRPLRALAAPEEATRGIADAVDMDLAPTEEGALLAWIEPIDPGNELGLRVLRVARVACQGS